MPDALGKVKRRALHEDVMVRLAAYLREGKLKPGDRLPPERELAGRMHVSRATIREALRVMQLQSLIVSRHGAGTFIAEGKAASLAQAVTQFALHDIFEARRLLDPSMAALAARRATPKDIAKLKSILKEQEENMQRGEDGGASDMRFHSAIAEATHNRAIIRLAQVLTEIFSPSRDAVLQSGERAKNSVLFHKRILKSIEAHSPEEARRAMAEHVKSVDRELMGKDISEFGGPTSLRMKDAVAAVAERGVHAASPSNRSGASNSNQSRSSVRTLKRRERRAPLRVPGAAGAFNNHPTT